MKLSDSIENHIQKYLNEIGYEAELLAKWFKQDFSESDLKVNLNYDAIRKTMTLSTRVLTKQETSDRALFENKIVIAEKQWFRTSYVDQIVKGINTHLRMSIAAKINSHYHNERGKDE